MFLIVYVQYSCIISAYFTCHVATSSDLYIYAFDYVQMFNWLFSCHTSIFFAGQDNFCLIHVSLIPVLGVVGEQVIL